MEPQEVSPMKHEMHVLGIDIAKRTFDACLLWEDCGETAEAQAAQTKERKPLVRQAKQFENTPAGLPARGVTLMVVTPARAKACSRSAT